MILTDDIRQRLLDYQMRNRLTQQDLANILGISQATAGRWLRGAVDFVEDKTGDRLLSLLDKGTQPSDFGILKPVPASDFRDVPVVGSARAAEFSPGLTTLKEFLMECSDETFPWFSGDVREGQFVMRVEGQSMAPDFPHGTMLLVSGGTFPERGDIVVAKLAEDGLVVKHYHRKDNVIYLTSLNEESGMNFEIRIKDQGEEKSEAWKIVWMFPVKGAYTELRDVRHWKHKLGKG